jgi:DNA methylase/SNF2-related domain
MNPTTKRPKKAINYTTFINSKARAVQSVGFDVSPDDLHPALKDFQRIAVVTALKKGRYALFEDCGLGKTIQQLEWANQIVANTGRAVLILTPLAVVGQTIQEGDKFGIPVKRWEEGHQYDGIYVTNYEQIDNINPLMFSGVVLDESSILKNYTGHTKRLLLQSFGQTPYRLCCTATPSPNDHMELGNHAEFLGVMNRSEMLATYFVHDGGDTAKWRLKGHAANEFWAWVASWALCLTSPSDIGCDATGYLLPELYMHERVVDVPREIAGLLFAESSVSATDFNAELRATTECRMQAAAEIVRKLGSEPVIVWINQDAEGDRLRELLPSAVEVRGSDNPAMKESRLMGFARGEFQILITKKRIAQFGLNYQHCAHQVFASLDFSFEGLYQAIRRSYRFGQTRQVHVHLITAPTMGNVIKSVRDKQAAFIEMQTEMRRAVEFYQTPSPMQTIQPAAAGHIESGREFTFYLGDCVQQIQRVETGSVHMSVFSPPFADLYTYSNHAADMGNSRSYEEFRQHFGYLVPELRRVMMPGRNVAVHCMDLPIQKGKEGYIGLRDFSGLIREAFEAEGFIYHSRITIWKDPVVEMQRTKALGLLHKQVKKDSVMSRVGMPDYILVFRAPGENPVPISQTDIPVDMWQKYASPVWMDINYGKTLQRESAREEKDEKHICPLQLDTIERLIHLWSNRGETVLTPFGGIGSEVYQALKMGRRGIGIELKEQYFNVAVRNCKSAEAGKTQLSIFDLMDTTACNS